MHVFLRINAYLQKGFQIIHQRGLKWVLQTAQVKLKARIKQKKSLSIENWLSYYESRPEISQPLITDSKKFPKVSILILTFNNLLINKLCLHSIYCNTTYPNFEVIVIDNASTDETPIWLKNYSKTHDNLKIILNLNNIGFAGGNNQAAREASGEYLIFLNNDTVVTHGWIERLLAHFEDDPKIGLVGPVTNATGNEALIPVNYVSPADMELFARRRAVAMSKQAFDIRMLAFYCVMARKQQFQSLGGLDERFEVGMFEDDDLAIRYHQNGLRVVCADDVFIHHFQGASFGKLDQKKYQIIFEENRKKYEEKWGRAWEPYQLRQVASSQITDTDLTSEPQKSWGKLSYRCNICGHSCETPLHELGRETPSCQCGSTVRSRAILHLLSIELFGQSIALPEFPRRPNLHGWGMSDAGYADLLAQKIDYINTYYDREPYFDITAPLASEIKGTLDFLISSEVFEHVAPPVFHAFENAKELLKPNGVLIFTVPYTLEPQTKEHFPELYQYNLVMREGLSPILRNITIDGQEQFFDNLVFHGGVGSTLEMRVFSKDDLIDNLKRAGFKDIKICAEPYWEFGIYWLQSWSLPIVARP